MVSAVSTFSSRSDRLSPVALALAALLHVLVVLVLWGLSVYRPAPRPPVEEPIEVVFESPKPAPKPPQTQPVPQPPPPAEPAFHPPAAMTADRRTQVPPPQPLSPVPSVPPPMPREASRAPIPQPSQPPRPLPKSLEGPGLPAPAPVPAPPLPSLLAPPPAPDPRPDPRPSPLTPTPARPPPTAKKPAEPPSPHPFVNPADAYSRARVADNYLWQIARKLEGYRYTANVNVSRGVTVVRVVIARNGRLLDVSIARSSGVPEFDRGVLSGVRAGSPYAPLPPDIKGDSASFDLPLVSVVGR